MTVRECSFCHLKEERGPVCVALVLPGYIIDQQGSSSSSVVAACHRTVDRRHKSWIKFKDYQQVKHGVGRGLRGL